MTYLLDDNDNELILSVDITVTKQIISFYNFKIKGNFSTNFGIPNTSLNRKSLGYSGLNQSGNIIFSTKKWNLFNNGNFLSRGLIVIQGETKDEIDCFFTSGNSSWLSILNGNLKDLNWTKYDQDFTVSNLDSTKSATSGMIFNYADWGYRWKKILYHIMVINPIFDSSKDENKFIYDAYPSFYLKTILDEISNQKGIKISGNILKDPIYDKMVIPLPYIDRRLEDPIYMTHDGGSNQTITAGATATVLFYYASNSSSLLDLSNNRILIDGNNRNIRLKTYFKFSTSFVGEVYIRKNGSTVSTYNFTIDSVSRYEVFSLAPGDYLDVQVKNTSAVSISITEKYFGYELCGSWYQDGLKIIARDVIPNTNIVDIVKYLAQAFNCIVDYDDFTQTISLNKIDSITKESALNLTDYIIDYDVQWQSEFAKDNYVRTNQTEDISAFNNGELKFGEFYFPGPDNGKNKNDLFELKFGPTITKLNETRGYYALLPCIPLFSLDDDGDQLNYTSTTNTGALLIIQGLSEQLLINTVIRIIDDSNYYNGYAYVSASTATTATLYAYYQGVSTTGKIYKQKINIALNAGFRILVNYPGCNRSYIAFSNIDLIDGGSSVTNISTTQWASYYIPSSFATASTQLKLGAHPGSINGAVSIPLSDQYYNRLKRIAQNPLIITTMRLSESVFNSINLSEFVYADIGDWSGYFLIQRILNYKDSITPVKVELLKID